MNNLLPLTILLGVLLALALAIIFCLYMAFRYAKDAVESYCDAYQSLHDERDSLLYHNTCLKQQLQNKDANDGR